MPWASSAALAAVLSSVALVGAACTDGDVAPASTTIASATTTAITAAQSEPAQTTDPTPTTSTSTTASSASPARPDPASGAAPADEGWLGRGAMTVESITLLWSGFDGITQFELHRVARDSVADPQQATLTAATLIYQGTETSHEDRTVSAGERYYYFLTAIGGSSEPPLRWTEADAVTDTEPPPPIARLQASMDGGIVTLRWNEGSDNYRFARYAIRRSVDDGPSEYYGTGWSIDQTQFVDDQLPDARSVTYEVRAVDFHGNASDPAVAVVEF